MGLVKVPYLFNERDCLIQQTTLPIESTVPEVDIIVNIKPSCASACLMYEGEYKLCIRHSLYPSSI